MVLASALLRGLARRLEQTGHRVRLEIAVLHMYAYSRSDLYTLFSALCSRVKSSRLNSISPSAKCLNLIVDRKIYQYKKVFDY